MQIAPFSASFMQSIMLQFVQKFTNLMTMMSLSFVNCFANTLTLMHAVFNIKYMLTLRSRFNFYYSHTSNVSLSTLQTEMNYFKFHF